MKRQKPKSKKPKKKASGAQGRRQRRERAKKVVSDSIDVQAMLEHYRQLGPPPADTVGRVEWANAICALVIYESVALSLMRDSAERKVILEGVRTLGMTAVKSLYEERLKKLESFVYGRRRRKGGADARDDELEDLDPKA